MDRSNGTYPWDFTRFFLWLRLEGGELKLAPLFQFLPELLQGLPVQVSLRLDRVYLQHA